MPSRKNLLAVAGRLGRSVTATPLALAACLAYADHGLPAPARSEFGWMSWLLVVGAVVAVGLAAWAFFAPDSEPDRGEQPGLRTPTPPDGTRGEPPAR